MAHRSNQAVASQERELKQPPEDPPTPSRVLASWSMALGALGISLILLGGGIWFVRHSIASFMLGAALSERGADADFEFVNLDLSGAALANIRFGSETSPDATIPLIEARWRWNGLSPQLHFLRIVRPRLHFRMDEGGRVSAGSLEHLGGSAPGRRRPSIPAIELEILEGQALIDTPFGPLNATLQSSGTLGEDFSATGQIVRTTHAGQAYALDNGAAELVVLSRDNTLAFRLSASANIPPRAYRRPASAHPPGRVPLDLDHTTSTQPRYLSRRASGIRNHGALSSEGIARPIGAETWAGEARGGAGDVRFGKRFTSARPEGRVDGGPRELDGFGRPLRGLSMISDQPSASGTAF